ncbi:gamma-glutamylcyclotransferase [Pseudonocardia phyllosphaerae]|uniref:gamma-glutamylcyclotransferase n=1 Tax=Pseudonocardia phyllosphaerae TaxID=3390502 RepID=UPI0039797701
MTLPGPPWPDALFPADPYPGARPPASFLHAGGVAQPVVADRERPSGWALDGRCLDDVLTGLGAAPLADRVPVLAYGSNACPSKISWMRCHRGLTGPVVCLRARVEGISAVWSAGRRVVDEQRPATLVAAPGVVEEQAVWFAAPEQFAALDVVEGRVAVPPRYRLAALTTGRVVLESGAVPDGGPVFEGGAVLDRPIAYIAPDVPRGDPRTDRRPLLVDGVPVPVTAVGQAGAALLTGVPGDDGLAATTVDGVPDPRAWPSRVFVYGSLMPGQRAWWRIEQVAASPPRPATLPGAAVADTGHGYPALTLGGTGVPGHVVELGDPAAAMPDLDRYEGPEYRRIRVSLADGIVCWAWLWIAGRTGLRPLPDGWARH